MFLYSARSNRHIDPVTSQRGAPVPRRYSEFVFLWDVLVKRYPFRLLPALPPKRIGRESPYTLTSFYRSPDIQLYLQPMKVFSSNAGTSQHA